MQVKTNREEITGAVIQTSKKNYQERGKKNYEPRSRVFTSSKNVFKWMPVYANPQLLFGLKLTTGKSAKQKH